MRFKKNSSGAYALTYERINGRSDGSQDKNVNYCLPSRQDKTPCVMVPRRVIENLQREYVQLQRDLDSCKNSR